MTFPPHGRRRTDSSSSGNHNNNNGGSSSSNYSSNRNTEYDAWQQTTKPGNGMLSIKSLLNSSDTNGIDDGGIHQNKHGNWSSTSTTTTATKGSSSMSITALTTKPSTSAYSSQGYQHQGILQSHHSHPHPHSYHNHPSIAQPFASSEQHRLHYHFQQQSSANSAPSAAGNVGALHLAHTSVPGTVESGEYAPFPHSLSSDKLATAAAGIAPTRSPGVDSSNNALALGDAAIHLSRPNNSSLDCQSYTDTQPRNPIVAAGEAPGFDAARNPRTPHRERVKFATTAGSEQRQAEIRYRPYPEIPHSACATPTRSTFGDTANDGSSNSQHYNRKTTVDGTLHKDQHQQITDDTQPQQQQQKRRRRTQACEYCHLKKIKCEGDGPRCTNCIKNDIQCQWGKKRKRGPKPKGTAKSQQIRGVSTAKDRRALSPLGSGAGTNTSPTLKQAALPPIAEAANAESSMPNGDDESIYLEKEPLASGPHPEILQPPPLDKEMVEFYSDRVDPEIRETVIYYFDYFYPLCPAFHPSLFIRRVVNGDVDPLLLDAMRATVARVITKKTGRFVDGHAIARSVKERILLGLERPTVDFLRVLIIMTLLAGSHGEYISYNSIICLAASLVVRMGLHKLDLYKRPNAGSWEEWVELQIKRRIFWLVYQTDSYQSMLTGRAMSIAESSVFVSAPCSDFEWDVVFHPNLAKASAAAKSLQKSSQSPQSPSRATPSSSSQSSSNLLQSLNVNPDHIIATGSFSYSFMALCELTAIIARINTFLCDAKASSTVLESTVVAASSGGNGAGGFGSDKAASSGKNKFRDGPFPAVDFLENEGDTTGSLVHKIRRSVKLTSEYPTFIELDNRLADWKNGLLLPEELCDESMPAEDISYFGTADHRRFMMRVRYFCLHCYYVPIVLVLHQSNRPSFFTEYEQPLEVRLNRRFTGVVDALTPSPLITDTHTNDDSGNGNSSSSNNSNDADYALRQMLSMAFADTWNEGLLAYDIESKSWQICVEAAHGLSEHLERNSDFPLERFDQVIPFCIFMATSVLLRQTKICKRLLGTQIDGIMTEEERVQRLRGAGGYAAVNAELARCIRHIKHQWSTLNSLGSLWDVEGMEQLLKSMQIDEVANAADLFSNLSL